MCRSTLTSPSSLIISLHFRNPDVFVIGISEYAGCLNSQNRAARFRALFQSCRFSSKRKHSKLIFPSGIKKGNQSDANTVTDAALTAFAKS